MSKKSKKAEKKARKADEAVEDHPNLLRARDVAARQQAFSHPWNPNSEIIGVRMGAELGLKRSGVSIARIPPGKESFAPHAHHREEEWIYILMGQGLAWVDGSEIAVGAGDFMAFPAPQSAHHLKNVGADDLVYLMGGENSKMDVIDFPTLGRRMVRTGAEIMIYDQASGQPFAPSKAGKAKKAKKS